MTKKKATDDRALRRAIQAGQVEKTLELLLATTATERRALAPFVAEWTRKVNEWQAPDWNDKREGERWRCGREAARLARLACAPDLEDTAAYYADTDDATVALLRKVRPPWLAGAAKELAMSNRSWQLARRLVHEGLSDEPAGWGELTNLMQDWRLGVWKHNRPLADQLVNDPKLLQDELWRMLQTEGSGNCSFAAADKYNRPELRWDVALIDLTRRGAISRDRLLDACLDALERDFAQFRAGWFSRLHEQLEPTLDERAARAGRYARLLQSAIPPTVSFALDALGTLAKAGRLPDDPDALRPALMARAKRTALAALKLVARAGSARLAVAALGHEAKEVQAAALDVIETHGERTDLALVAAMRERSRDVAATLRGRVLAWLGDESTRAKPAKVVGAVRRKPTTKRTSVLDRERAVVPITTLDALIERASAVLEEPDDPDALEQVFDGMARLCAERPADFAERVGPLRKRTRTFLDKRWAYDRPLRWELGRLALGWIDGALAARPGAASMDFLGARLDLLGERVARGEVRPLLSAPTHRGGFIDPTVLVERLSGGAPFDLPDAILALLRLAPEGRERALTKAAGLRSELGLALRHALGAPGVRVGPTAALWIAAARARAPGQDDPAVEKRHPRLGPGAGTAGRFSAEIREYTWGTKKQRWSTRWLAVTTTPAPPKKVPALHPTVRLHPHAPPGRADPHDRVGYTPEVRWAFTLWPTWKEPLFASGASIGSYDWDEDNGPIYATYLEPLADATTPLGPMARLLLARGLGARQPGDHGLAVDVTIAALEDGRLDPQQLGEALAITLPGARPPRLARTLSEVARVSPAHGVAVAQALARGLRGEPPRDVGALLDLLHDLLVEHGIALDDAEANAFLRGVTRGKAGKTAKALLTLAPGPSAVAEAPRPRRRAR